MKLIHDVARGKRLLICTAIGLALSMLLFVQITIAQMRVDIQPPMCFASLGSTTQYSSLDVSAVQNAVDAALPKSVVKVAGTCSGTQISGAFSVYISKSLTLRGGYTPANWNLSDPAANPTIIDANLHGRVIYISGVAGNLENLTLQNGYINNFGGGVYASGALILTNVKVLTSSAQASGGGLYSPVSLRIVSSLIQNNQSPSYAGGGAYTPGDVYITGTKFVNNTGKNNGGGLLVDNGAVTIINSSFINNHTPSGNGGGLADFSNYPVTLMNTQFMSNTAWGNSGGALVGGPTTAVDDLFQNNRCTDTPCTGAGLLVDNSLTMLNTRFLDNNAVAAGGGLAVYGAFTMTNSLFQDNQCTGASCNGGAFWANESGNLTNTRFINNTASNFGGGIYVAGTGRTRIVNAVFSRNAIDVGDANAIYIDGGKADILFTTIANPGLNRSVAAIAVSNAEVNITDTIFYSEATGIYGDLGSAVRENYNLFYNVNSQRVGNVVTGTNDVVGDPKFALLSNDDYHLISGSAAIDAGVGAGINRDIDGLFRPQRAGFDIGAYELPAYQIFLPVVLR